MQRLKGRWRLILAALAVILGVGAFISYKYALTALKDQIHAALGPNSEVKSLEVSFGGIEITGIRIRATKGKSPLNWLTEDELRAERILIKPSLIDLLSGKINLTSIEIDGAYLSVLRTRNGKLSIVPSLLDKPVRKTASVTDKADKTDKTTPAITIGKLVLKNAAVEFFDTSVRPRVKLNLEKIDVELGTILWPSLQGQTRVTIKGIVKGKKQNGTLDISGEVELASYELGLVSQLRAVELALFQPYLLKAGDMRIKNGLVDFELNSAVKKGQLRAPGSITLSQLELAAKSPSAKFAGIPQNVALELLKGRTGNIAVRFLLEGDINNPKFSLNENLRTRFGLAFADTLGVKVENLTKQLQNVGGIKGISDLLKKSRSNKR